MEENIYDFLGLTPKDGEAKVKEELEAQIKKWTNQLTRQAARAKAKLEVLKRFKAELGTNPNMLKEHADKYTSLIAQKKQQQEKSIREDASIYVVNGQIEEAALAELAKKNSAFSKEEILSIIGATIKKKKEFRYKETGSGRELDPTLFKRILEDLAKVKKRDLYDFLCVPANAPSSLIKQICEEYSITKLKEVVCGGATRQESVARGFQVVSKDADLVSIHDAARPLITTEQVIELISAADRYGAACAASRVVDTIKKGTDDLLIRCTVPREDLYAVQTPQIFRTDAYRVALAIANKSGISVTDDCSLIENAGFPIKLCLLSGWNLKLTTIGDIHVAESILKERTNG